MRRLRPRPRHGTDLIIGGLSWVNTGKSGRDQGAAELDEHVLEGGLCLGPVPGLVGGNSATPSSSPARSSASATFTSRWVSTPLATGRGTSTMVIIIPSACLVSSGFVREC
jgi:hypothetical protein